MLHNQYAFRPNTLYHGDCLEVMKRWDDDSVDLIYLDPPFNSNANYNILYGKDPAGQPRDEPAQFTAFKDTWFWSADAGEKVREISRAAAHPAHLAIKGLAEMLPETGMLAYLVYMAERLAMMQRVLKDSGSIYLHCDPTASHYLKMIMDCVFGANNFRQEIIWYRYNKIDDKRKVWCKYHDTILCYSRSPTMTWHPLTVGTGEMVTRKKIKKIDGKIANTDELVTYERQKCLTRSVIDNIPDIAIGSSKQKLGYPTQARKLAAEPFLYEQWAVTTLPGFEPNEKQTGDGGVDGLGYLLHPPNDEKGRCVVQVKSGGYSPDSLRALLSKITGGYASIGVFVTMDKMRDTPTARACVDNAGQLREGAKTFNRLLFWSMEEHFAGARLHLPAMAHPRTGKPLQEAIPSA